MHSKYLGYSMWIKATAFIPCVIGFVTFFVLIAEFGTLNLTHVAWRRFKLLLLSEILIHIFLSQRLWIHFQVVQFGLLRLFLFLIYLQISATLLFCSLMRQLLPGFIIIMNQGLWSNLNWWWSLSLDNTSGLFFLSLRRRGVKALASFDRWVFLRV